MDAPPPPGPEVLRWLTQPCPGAWDFGSCTWRPWLERHRSRAWGARHGCVGHPWWVLSAHLTAQLAKFQTPITRITFPTCRAHYPGGSEPVHRSGASPFHAAFPERQTGRHPRFQFRGLLRLHSRYGPLDRPAAQGGLCHEASSRPFTRPPGSSATRSTDNSLGGSSLH